MGYGELLAFISARQKLEYDEMRKHRRIATLLYNQWNDKPVTEQEFMRLPDDVVHEPAPVEADALIDILSNAFINNGTPTR